MHCEALCFYTDLGFGVLYIQTDMSQFTTHILHVAFLSINFIIMEAMSIRRQVLLIVTCHSWLRFRVRSLMGLPKVFHLISVSEAWIPSTVLLWSGHPALFAYLQWLELHISYGKLCYFKTTLIARNFYFKLIKNYLPCNWHPWLQPHYLNAHGISFCWFWIGRSVKLHDR